jgi:hypothetical protein
MSLLFMSLNPAFRHKCAVFTGQVAPLTNLTRNLQAGAWRSRLRGEMMLLKTDLTIKTNIQNFAAAALLLISASTISSSAQAFTCDDVRHLTSAEQNYYVKLLHISAVQRHQIWVACYRDYRPGLQAQLVQR